MTLQIIILALFIIVLHIQAGLMWEMYFKQDDARQKEKEEQQNSEEIVNANTRTFAIWEEENNEQDK